jgi:hypothetical protein
MEKELSVKQIQNILKWSYPTALNFAQENGHRVESEFWPLPRWFVPFDVVAREVAKRENEVEAMKLRLAAARNGS